MSITQKCSGSVDDRMVSFPLMEDSEERVMSEGKDQRPGAQMRNLDPGYQIGSLN